MRLFTINITDKDFADLKHFRSIFSLQISINLSKVQYSHSRYQKTTSNLLRINLKGLLKFNKIWPLEGAMYITLWLLSFMQFLRKFTVSDKKVYRAFKTHRTLQTKLIRKLFHFHHLLPKLYIDLKRLVVLCSSNMCIRTGHEYWILSKTHLNTFSPAFCSVHRCHHVAVY